MQIAGIGLVSCERLDDDIETHTGKEDSVTVGLDQVARMLSALPIE